ncbi:MAG: dephospho-CoA kinase [Acidimicrobiaceae bacterium]|jgi:dephospho-CoA kinase|nr:dephospho-CoA kinase [Acidimicrobiaceae bacterium]|tara:strand:+ start:1803 stop:2426 length:624 start_codon:yes stop_codon:yes gene_type:complete
MTAKELPQGTLEIGLTGGIGSGKSTVSAGLVKRGAVLVDADAIVRDLQKPGKPVFKKMVERWGEKIITNEGELDRQAVADIVFKDAEELAALNEIVHPLVREEIANQREKYIKGNDPIILDIPLLIESGYENLSGIIVVDLHTEEAVERLVKYRGFSREDALNRISSQVDREERLSKADFVIDNNGDLDSLENEIDKVWSWIKGLSA